VSVTSIELPRVVFKVEVADELDVIGRVSHVRFVINKAKQAERISKKFHKVTAMQSEQAAGQQLK
jgi:predicted thioesterase